MVSNRQGPAGGGAQSVLGLPGKAVPYTPKQEAANDAWRARTAKDVELKREHAQALVPRARAGDKEAQAVLRSIIGQVCPSAVTSASSSSKGASSGVVKAGSLGQVPVRV